MPQAALSHHEIARKGEELYQGRIRSAVERENRGRFLVLDVLSGEYEIADDELPAIDALRLRRSEGEFYILRIGYPAHITL